MKDRIQNCWSEFREIETLADAGAWDETVVSHQDNRHIRPDPLRVGQRAVYLFYTPHAVLKVGQTNYPQRFTSQHYGVKRSGSTLAKDLDLNREEFGIETDDIQQWMYDHLGRSDFVFPAGFPDDVVRMFECFLHYRLGPRFEGRRQ